MQEDNRRLVAGEEAIPRATQHKRPCADCPWARTALNGWLGDMTADEWLQVAVGEVKVDCHTCGNQQCAGLAIFRANIAKSPRDKTILVLPADRDKVFATPAQFKEHHESKLRKRS